MKIVYHYTAFGTVGGTDRMILSKASYLADVYGYDVCLLTDSQHKGGDFFFPVSKNVKHVDLGIDFSQEYNHNFIGRVFWYYKLMRIYKKRLILILDKLNPDVLVVTLGREMAIIKSLRKKGRRIVGETHLAKPFVRNLHLLREQGGFYSIVAKYLEYKQEHGAKFLDKLVVLTKATQEQWEPFANTVIIPNFNNLYPERLIKEKYGKTVIAVGRLNDQKGYDLLVESWKQVFLRHPTWKVRIYGNGEGKWNILKQISDAGLEKVITIHEPIKNIEDVYMRSDFYVLSSRYEGWGLVLLEAMGCGIPCVSFDCPDGPSDIIQNGVNGILVENGNIDQLAEMICWMIEHPQDRIGMGENGRKRALDFTQDVIMRKWKKLFEGITNK